jgi:hypothetical protein
MTGHVLVAAAVLEATVREHHDSSRSLNRQPGLPASSATVVWGAVSTSSNRGATAKTLLPNSPRCPARSTGPASRSLRRVYVNALPGETADGNEPMTEVEHEKLFLALA